MFQRTQSRCAVLALPDNRRLERCVAMPCTPSSPTVDRRSRATCAPCSSRLLSGNASTAQRDWVRWNMAQLNLPGYTQAVHLLCGDAIENYALSGAVCAVASVHCGSADNVTTPDDCRLVAQRHGLPFSLIDQAGHACYVERPAAATAAILN